MKTRKSFLLPMFLTLASVSAWCSDAPTPKPKYGPKATLLSESHDYIQKHAAADYWVLSPYYLPQQDDRSCSVASVTMLVNAVRSGQKKTSEDELATQSALLKKVNDTKWIEGVGPSGHGVSLDELGGLIEKSLKAYDAKNFDVKVVHTNDTKAETKKQLHADLVENEKSNKNFIVINFIQGVFTGDADVGHIAPIAAYDGAKKRVLILDPDRQWYEPYWVSEDTLLDGMATQDKTSGHFRGYVKITVK